MSLQISGLKSINKSFCEDVRLLSYIWDNKDVFAFLAFLVGLTILPECNI